MVRYGTVAGVLRAPCAGPNYAKLYIRMPTTGQISILYIGIYTYRVH